MAANIGKRKGGRGPRPHVWRVGPDEYKHQMYIPFLKAKAQAKFREEPWELEFEDYFTIWNGFWADRGRDTDSLCMTRKDWSGSWSPDNIELISRLEHCRRQAANSMAKWQARGLKRRYKSKHNPEGEQ